MAYSDEASKRKCYHENKHENIWQEKIKINCCDDDADDDGEEADGKVNDNDDDDDDDDNDDGHDDGNGNGNSDACDDGDDDVGGGGNVDDNDDGGGDDDDDDDDGMTIMMVIDWLINLFAYYFVNRFIIQGRIHGGTTIKHEVRDWSMRPPLVNKKENLIPDTVFSNSITIKTNEDDR